MAKSTKTPNKTLSHSADAAALLGDIRSLREKIPGFTQPQSSQAARRIIANAAVPDGFLESVSVAVQSSPSLKDASAVDPEAVRDVIRFSAAYAPVAEELEALARAVRHTISVKRAETAQSSLAAYDLAKGLARKTDGADLVPHIAEMRKNLNRGGSRRRMAAKPATNS